MEIGVVLIAVSLLRDIQAHLLFHGKRNIAGCSTMCIRRRQPSEISIVELGNGLRRLYIEPRSRPF